MRYSKDAGRMKSSVQDPHPPRPARAGERGQDPWILPRVSGACVCKALIPTQNESGSS